MENLDFLIERKILRLGNRLLNQRNDDLKALDLTPEQAETLLFFDRHRGAIVLELKNYLEISHQAARNIVERMKKKGLLYVEVSPADARARQIFLTQSGQDICDILKRTGASVGHQMLDGIDIEERRRLFALLEKMSENIE